MAMEIKRFTASEIDFTTVTEEGSEALRAVAVLPFEAEQLRPGGIIPSNTPHILEHIVCNGDGTSPRETYEASGRLYGGYSNAFTTRYINGKLSFETQQPADHTKIATDMFKAIAAPNFSLDNLENEREVTRNEHVRRLQDPQSIRADRMGLFREYIYGSDETALERQNEINLDHLQTVYNGLAQLRNLRILLAGSPDTVKKLSQSAIEIFAKLPAGNKTYALGSRINNYDDYHADAPEYSRGTCTYGYGMVFETSFGQEPIKTKDEALLGKIANNSIASFLNDPERGILPRSRSEGLSYGITAGLDRHLGQWVLSISDTVDYRKVDPQISLLRQRLSELLFFSAEDFERMRDFTVGNFKIRPMQLIDVAKSSEHALGTEEGDDAMPTTQTEYVFGLAEADPTEVVSLVRGVAAQLQVPQFINRASFGANPFS